jgi:hypothetical protein
MKQWAAVCVALVVFLPLILSAQTAVPCLSEAVDKVLVPVVYTHPGDFARSSTLPHPVIYVDPAIQNFLSDAQMLIFGHECHHATHSYVNEDEADVYAGRLMRMSGKSREETRAAALEVFRWTTTNNGHSIPATRVQLVLEGYSSGESKGANEGDDNSGPTEAGDIPRECVVSEADIEGVDLSDAIPDYERDVRAFLERGLKNQQRMLEESIEVCKKAVASMRRYPGDRDFSQYVADAKNDIAKHSAYIPEVKKALRDLPEE